MPFSVRTDRPLIPIEASDRFLRVEIFVPRPDAEEARKPAHVSLVIDRSGSMAGDKLRLALEAARHAIRTLRDGDRFSVVTFDHEVRVVVPSTEATGAARIRAEAQLDTITSGGNTDLAGGWLTGCAEVGSKLRDDAIGRCLLLTDGQANHGITAPDELARHARELRQRRVTTSTLGLGAGFNEFLLGRLSEEGGGNFYFAERADELPGFVAREIGEVMSVVARDACVIIAAPEGVDIESLNDYPCTREGGAFAFALGSLAGGQALARTFRVRVPAGTRTGEEIRLEVRLVDRDGALDGGARTVVFTRASSDDLGRQIPDGDVARPAASLIAAQAHKVALELNQQGKRSEASAHLGRTAARLRESADGDASIVAEASRLDREKDVYAAPMTSLSSKGAYMRAYMAQKLGLQSTDEEDDARSGVTAKGKSGIDALAIATSSTLAAPLERAARAINAVDGAQVIEVRSAPALAAIGSAAEPLHDAHERRIAVAAQAIDRSRVKVVFVEQPLRDGWFSHWHEAERVAVVSIAGWDALTSVPAAAFVAYELVLHGLRAASPRYDTRSLLHAETRGCLFDLCTDKAEVEIKLQAGHVCASCERQLDGLGIDRAALAAVWSAVQSLAHGG